MKKKNYLDSKRIRTIRNGEVIKYDLFYKWT